MSYPQCTQVLQLAHKPYPRTCAECGLGPCKQEWGKATAEAAKLREAEPQETLRDRFAMAALTGMVSDFGDSCEGYRNAIAKRAYMLADAMLKARA